MPENKVGAETRLTERPQSALRRRLNQYFNFPVVIDPFGKPFYRWQIIIATAVLYNIFCVPSRMAFQQLREPTLELMWWVLDYTCDGLYLIDIVWHLFIGTCVRMCIWHFSNDERRVKVPLETLKR